MIMIPYGERIGYKMNKISINLTTIQEAAAQMTGIINQTPLIRAPWLGQASNTRVYLKLENLQITGSFKCRGALTKILSLSKDQRARGLIAVSAGNHAQGVAIHAQRLGLSATIVMPIHTPVAKVEQTEALGAHVVLYGENLAQSFEKAQSLINEENLTLIHPFNDPFVITGQGTIALEILTQCPEINTLIIPIGGGGLCSGIAIAAKALNPSIEIYGVQSIHCPSMIQALYPERSFIPQELHRIPIAEGIMVKTPGQLTQKILKEHLTDILAVSDDHIEDAINQLVTCGKLVAEGAGAAGVAALLAHGERFKGKTVGTVICGGNIDSRILSSELMRALVRQGKLVRLQIQLHDSPGSLGRITKIIGDEGGNIFELTHQRYFSHLTVKMTEVDVCIETRGLEHAHHIIHQLQLESFPARFIE